MALPVNRFRPLIVLLVFAIVVLVVLADITYRDVRRDLARQETLQQAKLLQAVLQQMPSSDTAQVASFLNNVPSAAQGFEGWYFYAQGPDSLRPFSSPPAGFHADSLIKLYRQMETREPFIATLPDGKWLVVAPLKSGGYLMLSKTPPTFHRFSADFWLYFTPLLVFVALLLLGILGVFYQAFKRPLRSVRNLADHLQAGDYQYRIRYGQHDEFSDVFTRINQSLERLGSDDKSYRQKESHIRTLLEALDESIVVLTENLKLRAYNPAAVRLLRCQDENTFATYFARIVEENMALRDLFRQFKTIEKTILTRELVIWIRDNQELPVNLTLQRLDQEHFLVTFKDLSRIKELQNHLLRSMKFGLIANLVSSISHEIRNPLSAVGIHTEILSTRLNKAYPDLDPKLKKSLTIIQNEIKRINRIHTQFFNLARKRELSLSSLKPNALIDDVVQLVKHHALEQQIHLKTDLDANIDFIYGDADQLKQVILNVVLNAFQAVGEEGQVVVKTRQDSRNIYLEIHDNGPGIPPEIGERIFDLYFTTKPDGGGIGLALCKKIVEAHEGRIWYRSSTGQGTTFIIAIPRIGQTHKERIQTRLQSLKP